MLRNVIRLHTMILAAASIALLVAPGQILASFGIVGASFAVLALTRIIAGILTVVAVAVLPLPELPVPARSRALATLAAAYALLAILALVQQVAIWASLAGGLLAAAIALHAVAFALLAREEHRPLAAGASRRSAA